MGIDYDNTTGIITFNEIGQYSIKWWVSTETTLKGAIGFELQSSQGNFTSGCSPIKTGTKAYMLITPMGAPSIRVYRGNLSTSGSFIEVPLGNGLFYRLEYLSNTQLRLFLTPMNGPTLYDYRRFCSYNGVTATQGDYSDNATLSGSVTKNTEIFNNSQEIHWVLIRVQNPISRLWSTYEVRFFASGGMSRTTVWVNVIEEEVRY